MIELFKIETQGEGYEPGKYTDIVFHKDQIIIYNESECLVYNMNGVEKFS